MKTCRHCRLPVPNYYVGSTDVCFDCEGPAISSSDVQWRGRAPRETRTTASPAETAKVERVRERAKAEVTSHSAHRRTNNHFAGMC
jgi:hypothetical protein